MRGYSSKMNRWIRNMSIQRFETAKRKYQHQQEISCLPYRPPKARKFCEIAWKCVKLSFRKWKCSMGLGSEPILSYQRKTSREGG